MDWNLRSTICEDGGWVDCFQRDLRDGCWRGRPDVN
jgi:hypothetical protein